MPRRTFTRTVLKSCNKSLLKTCSGGFISGDALNSLTHAFRIDKNIGRLLYLGSKGAPFLHWNPATGFGWMRYVNVKSTDADGDLGAEWGGFVFVFWKYSSMMMLEEMNPWCQRSRFWGWGRGMANRSCPPLLGFPGSQPKYPKIHDIAWCANSLTAERQWHHLYVYHRLTSVTSKMLHKIDFVENP